MMLFGACVMTAGTQMPLSATLTDQGSYLGTQETSQPMLIKQETVLPAASNIEIATTGMGVIAFGMLMFLCGFGLHAIIVLRERDEETRKIPVKLAPRKHMPPVREKLSRDTRRQMDVIWVERTIRF